MKGDERAVGWGYAAAVYALVAVIIVYASAVFFFVPRETDIDDLGLFNPIYMQIHYHHMSYPVYGPGFYFHSMFVHPPTRYLEIASLMRLGLSLPYAQELSVFLLTIALAVIIATSRFSGLSKLALLFGFFAGLVWTGRSDYATYGLRPDAEIALCWFLGLVLLQDGMLRAWNLPRLFFGSLALTYASGLHYYAVLSFLGVFYYAAKAWGELSKQSFRNVILIMGAGCCLFGVPYLALFVIPHAEQILRISAAVQSAGGWFGPILRHFDQYSYWLSPSTDSQGVRALFYLLYLPLWLRVPLFIVGSILLAMRRETRGIAIASLPLTAFVFAISHGKSAGYYVPELIIYFSGIGALAGQILQVLASKIPFGRREVLVPLLLAGAACWVTRIGQPVYKDAQISFQPLQSTMDVARACAKRLVGPDAFIAGRVGLWYISGAAKWYDVSIDLLWQKHISSIDLPKYFSQFDDVVEHNQGSDVSVNAQGEALASWYVSGLLKLHGFFLDSSPQTNPANNVSFLVFRTKASPLEGYLLNSGHVFHFEENREGNNVFIARLCRLENVAAYFNLPNFDAVYLPKQAHEDFQRALVVSVMTKDELATQRRRLDSQCALLSTTGGTLRQLPLDNLMAEAAKQERPIRFYQNTSDAIVPTLHTIRIPMPLFDLQHLRLAYDAAKITGEQTKTVTTARAPWSNAAFLDIPKNLPPRSWIAIRLRVITGELGLDVSDPRNNCILTRRFVVRADGPQEIYLAVSSSTSPRQLIIQNGDVSGSSKLVLQSIGLISEQRKD